MEKISVYEVVQFFNTPDIFKEDFPEEYRYLSEYFSNEIHRSEFFAKLLETDLLNTETPEEVKLKNAVILNKLRNELFSESYPETIDISDKQEGPATEIGAKLSFWEKLKEKFSWLYYLPALLSLYLAYISLPQKTIFHWKEESTESTDFIPADYATSMVMVIFFIVYNSILLFRWHVKRK